MIVIDEKLLDTFREAKACEFCSKPTPSGCDPHHIIAKGMGGGGRVDIPDNLIALCRECHISHHAGAAPTTYQCFDVAGARAGKMAEDCREMVWRVQREDKCSEWRLS